MRDISVVICTHNGAKTINRAIQSLIKQSLPQNTFEILIIDNASTDNTEAVVRRLNDVKNLRYFFEPKLGLSNARNKGWMNAEGKYVAYLDDDAIAGPDWLERILNAFLSVPTAGAVGGKVDPVWEVAPPPWVNDLLKRFLSLLDWSETPVVLDDRQYLVGTNICFPRMILDKYSGFPADLGRKGKTLISNEEIELIKKIKKDNYAVYYDPRIRVEHIINSSRLKPNWFRRRFFSQGISDAILYQRTEHPSTIKKISYAIRILLYILTKPQKLFFASYPSLFPAALPGCHQHIIMLGFLYGLFRTEN